MIDTGTLLLYAFSFVLYIVSTVIELVAFNFFFAKNHFFDITNDYAIALMFWSFCSFVSQVLLCFILWDLSNEDDKSGETKSFDEISV